MQAHFLDRRRLQHRCGVDIELAIPVQKWRRWGETFNQQSTSEPAARDGRLPASPLDYTAQAMPPLSSLVYPRVRVATLCLPSAIEFHVLGDVIHQGVSAEDWYETMGLSMPRASAASMRTSPSLS